MTTIPTPLFCSTPPPDDDFDNQELELEDEDVDDFCDFESTSTADESKFHFQVVV